MHKASLFLMTVLMVLMSTNSGLTAFAGHHNSHKSKHQAAAVPVQQTPTGNYIRYDKNGEKIIHFANLDWHIRPSGIGFPGPNKWSSDNVWLDSSGCLHLALTKVNNAWYSSEIYTDKRLSYGVYQAMLEGAVDKLAKNVVLGLFTYPDDSVSQDGTNEIDIEFSRWGNSAWPNLNYTVWPVNKAQASQSRSVNFSLSGTLSTHRFVWSPNSMLFQSMDGLTNTTSNMLVNWIYAPSNPATHISQTPQTFHMNLWTVDGKAPSDGRPVDIIIRDFTYTPGS